MKNLEVIDRIKTRRAKVLSGGINCIPCPFKRFRNVWVGIEQGKYYGITATQKAGKTKFANYLFMYYPLIYAMDNSDKIRVKIKYFEFEMSEEDLYHQLLCHYAYYISNGKYRFSPTDLKSTDNTRPISSEVLSFFETELFQKYLDFFDKNVEIITTIRNPTGVKKYIDSYAKANGNWTKKKIPWTNNDTGEVFEREVNDKYHPNDPDEYVIIITDHISLTQPESGLDLKRTIERLSTIYVDIRNDYGYIPVVIQQQATSGQGVENLKLGKLKPSVADLGDSKLTGRDFNILFGVFSPFMFELKTYMGYSIEDFEDNIRFVEMIIAREGGAGHISPLYFDGAIDLFKEMPPPHEYNSINKLINYAKSSKLKTNHIENIQKIALVGVKINNKNKKLWQKLLAFLGCQEKAKQQVL